MLAHQIAYRVEEVLHPADCVLSVDQTAAAVVHEALFTHAGNTSCKASAAVIEARSGRTGFNPKLISKDLSNLQRSYATNVLRQHGYARCG
jgi:hypothetical protein